MSVAGSIKGMKLPPACKVVLLALAIEGDGGNAAPSIPALQAITCCARSTVLAALAELEATGVISRRRAAGKRTEYVVHEATRPPVEPSVSRTVRKASHVTSSGRMH